jgi:hypothetical protein
MDDADAPEVPPLATRAVAERASELLRTAGDSVWPEHMVRNLWDGAPPDSSWDPLAQQVKRMAGDLMAVDRRLRDRAVMMDDLRRRMKAIAIGETPDAEDDVPEDESPKERRARFSRLSDLLRLLGSEERFERDSRDAMLLQINECFNRAQDRKVQLFSDVLRAWQVQMKDKNKSIEDGTAVPSTEELMRAVNRKR